ncbi:hypothetical protein EVAR_3525_1 [Eumeta japonica]|uniref:Uncharacterized protein n=1 Tax=Eumeta variegata TaxID=151549 RepID=A0A4C1SW40_EUMVA|nr:hypothetical protein EVAR_3525_1 [Eumeta japonica]
MRARIGKLHPRVVWGKYRTTIEGKTHSSTGQPVDIRIAVQLQDSNVSQTFFVGKRSDGRRRAFRGLRCDPLKYKLKPERRAAAPAVRRRGRPVSCVGAISLYIKNRKITDFFKQTLISSAGVDFRMTEVLSRSEGPRSEPLANVVECSRKSRLDSERLSNIFLLLHFDLSTQRKCDATMRATCPLGYVDVTVFNPTRIMLKGGSSSKSVRDVNQEQDRGRDQQRERDYFIVKREAVRVFPV